MFDGVRVKVMSSDKFTLKKLENEINKQLPHDKEEKKNTCNAMNIFNHAEHIENASTSGYESKFTLRRLSKYDFHNENCIKLTRNKTKRRKLPHLSFSCA